MSRRLRNSIRRAQILKHRLAIERQRKIEDCLLSGSRLSNAEAQLAELLHSLSELERSADEPLERSTGVISVTVLDHRSLTRDFSRNLLVSAEPCLAALRGEYSAAEVVHAENCGQFSLTVLRINRSEERARRLRVVEILEKESLAEAESKGD